MINDDLRSKAENGSFIKKIPLLIIPRCFGGDCRIKTDNGKPEQSKTNEKTTQEKT